MFVEFGILASRTGNMLGGIFIERMIRGHMVFSLVFIWYIWWLFLMGEFMTLECNMEWI